MNKVYENWTEANKEEILQIVATFLQNNKVYSSEQVWQSDSILTDAPELVAELAHFWLSDYDELEEDSEEEYESEE